MVSETPGDGSVADTGASSDSPASDAPKFDAPIPPSDARFDQSCTMAGMCVLVPRTCCGSCGLPSPTDEIAVPRDKASEYRTLVCKADAGPIGCPDCAGIGDPNLQAFCRGGECVPVNVPTDTVSACSTDDDCQLAQGVCCGPCGGEFTLVGVAKSKLGEFRRRSAIRALTVQGVRCQAPRNQA